MNRILPLMACLACSIQGATAPHRTQRKNVRSAFDEARVNNPNLITPVRPGSSGAAVLRAQILLDRAKFSCGEIDGAYGRNLGMAIKAYQEAHDIAVTGVVGPQMWKLLNADEAPALFEYVITPEDVAGPFEKIPSEMLDKANLKVLNYESPLEGIAEKLHVAPPLLAKLNAGKKFDEAGVQIVAPNVITAAPGRAASIVVSGTNRTVVALDAAGKMLAFYPATVGSEHDPLPVGEWKVTIIQRNPLFFYNSDLFWDANEQHAKAKIPPGPNNPVGVVWIGLSKEHYGIHGSPEPHNIGHTQSHGCIRLTNWNASELAHMVAKGTPAILKE